MQALESSFPGAIFSMDLLLLLDHRRELLAGKISFQTWLVSQSEKELSMVDYYTQMLEETSILPTLGDFRGFFRFWFGKNASLKDVFGKLPDKEVAGIFRPELRSSLIFALFTRCRIFHPTVAGRDGL